MAQAESSWWSWGSSAVQYAASTVNNFLGYEDLQIVDPEASKATKGTSGTKEVPLEKERKQAWGAGDIQKHIGMDVMSLMSVPVWIMEPDTILQKAAEITEYTELLDQANQCPDPHQRFVYVAAFCVSAFSASERAWKPFNPVLGETFEVEAGSGVRYLAEQVSHHPPVCAAHAENAHFTYDLVSAPTTKFLGNALEVYPYGRTRIRLRGHSNELYTLVPPNCMVHNIIIGRAWVDVFGPMYLHCATSGATCVLTFTPCGFFSHGRYEFSGHVCDQEGVKRVRVWGKWNEHCDSVPCGPDGEAVQGADSQRLWTCNAKPQGDYYGYTHYAHQLNSSANIRTPLASDSRRRPDRAALARGEMALAGSEKQRVEETQRAERRKREEAGAQWQPRWFDAVRAPELLPGELDLDKVPFYEFNGKYLQLPLADMNQEHEAVDGKGFCPGQAPVQA